MRRCWPLAALLPGCAGPESACDLLGGGGDGENVLVLVTDDIGVDKYGAYGEHPSPPPTPTLDALAAEGVRFTRAYASPTCSPSRASLLTGRMPSRHGIGRWIYSQGEDVQLPPEEITIPRMLEASPHDYARALVGKWHLTGFAADGAATHPLDVGFDCHCGSLGNPLEAISGGHTPRSYSRWEKMWDGEPGWSHDYMTTDSTQEALARVAGMREPWFLMVAYTAAHEPLHVAPDSLRTLEVDEGSSDLELFDAMVESVDTEIGRLLDGIPAEVRARTTIVYLTDNGTPKHGTAPPWDEARHKGTVYDGGVRIPLVIAGPHVADPGSTSDALVHVVDLWPTVAEIAGVDPATVQVEEGPHAGEPVTLDGTSLLPLLEDPSAPGPRDVVFAEGFYPNGDVPRSYTKRMVREAGWKLIELRSSAGVTETLHRYTPGAVDEGPDLLAAGGLDPDGAEALARLRLDLDLIVADLEAP